MLIDKVLFINNLECKKVYLVLQKNSVKGFKLDNPIFKKMQYESSTA